VRRFLAGLGEVSSGEAAAMDQVGRLLVELATDEEFFAPLIAAMPADAPAVHWLAKPERDPASCWSTGPRG
jgi:hypothetical protein